MSDGGQHDHDHDSIIQSVAGNDRNNDNRLIIRGAGGESEMADLGNAYDANNNNDVNENHERLWRKLKFKEILFELMRNLKFVRENVRIEDSFKFIKRIMISFFNLIAFSDIL